MGAPSGMPTMRPTDSPTLSPTTLYPTESPTTTPTGYPTGTPTYSPTPSPIPWTGPKVGAGLTIVESWLLSDEKTGFVDFEFLILTEVNHNSKKKTPLLALGSAVLTTSATIYRAPISVTEESTVTHGYPECRDDVDICWQIWRAKLPMDVANCGKTMKDILLFKAKYIDYATKKEIAVQTGPKEFLTDFEWDIKVPDVNMQCKIDLNGDVIPTVEVFEDRALTAPTKIIKLRRNVFIKTTFNALIDDAVVLDIALLSGSKPSNVNLKDPTDYIPDILPAPGAKFTGSRAFGMLIKDEYFESTTTPAAVLYVTITFELIYDVATGGVCQDIPVGPNEFSNSKTFNLPGPGYNCPDHVNKDNWTIVGGGVRNSDEFFYVDVVGDVGTVTLKDSRSGWDFDLAIKCCKDVTPGTTGRRRRIVDNEVTVSGGSLPRNAIAETDFYVDFPEPTARPTEPQTPAPAYLDVTVDDDEVVVDVSILNGTTIALLFAFCCLGAGCVVVVMSCRNRKESKDSEVRLLAVPVMESVDDSSKAGNWLFSEKSSARLGANISKFVMSRSLDRRQSSHSESSDHEEATTRRGEYEGRAEGTRSRRSIKAPALRSYISPRSNTRYALVRQDGQGNVFLGASSTQL